MTETQMGCNDVIMLITDGAPGYFKNVFELYNENKRVINLFKKISIF